MNKAAGFILAVDGGGTKTTVWVANASGEVLGKATAGPMSLAATSASKAAENFFMAVEEVTTQLKIVHFSRVFVGLAGVDTQEEEIEARHIFSEVLGSRFTFDTFEVMNDILIALESGTSSLDAICLISGTGSNCFGRNSNGKTAKTSGMDFLLSDQGSGFEIGQEVLRAAVKSFDGRSKKTLIEELVCDHFKIKSIDQLKNKVYHPILNKTQIGQLSSIAYAAREQHDTIANEIISHAVEELVEMVVTVLLRLELTNTPTDVVLIGGIATDPYMKEQLEARIKANYSKVQVIVPKHPPVYGALQLALRAK